MINEHPVDTHGEVVRFGNPWHGVVQGGTLTLPPGGSIATKVWPQPAIATPRNQTGVICDTSGTDAVGVIAQAPMREFDIAGFTHAFIAPDAPAPLPPDADPAKQWRDKALLSGRRTQLYGKELDGWIAAPAPGVRQKITLTIPPGPVDMQVPLTLTATRDNFGFDVPAAPESLSATLTDWKQYGAGQPLLMRSIDNPVYSNLNGNCKKTGGTPAPDVTNPTYKMCRLTLYAISPTGDRALIEVAPATAAETVTFRNPAHVIVDPMIRRPIGWLLVTFTAGGMTVEAALSRAQTLGTAISNASEISWSGYVVMGFFRHDGQIGWFSWSGYCAQVLGVTSWTRVTRMDSLLAPTADQIEISVVDATGSSYGPTAIDFLLERTHITFCPSLSYCEDIWPLRIGNGAVTFMRGPSHSAIVFDETYSNHAQAITPLGVASIPVQSTVIYTAATDITVDPLPFHSSYNHATGEISPLWQLTPICWV